MMKTEAYIVIKDCTKDELKTMLNDWLVMYVDDLKSKMTFGIAEVSPGTLALKVDKGIDDTRFFYMVNYFSAPFDFDRTFDAEGYTVGTKHKKLLGKSMYVFINTDDREYDNVWMTTEDDETYKFDFGGKLKKMPPAGNYKTCPTAGLSPACEQINVGKKELLEEAARRREEQSRRSAAKRFKVVSKLLFVLIPAAHLINRFFPYMENELLTMLSSLAITGWFLMDHRIFYSPRQTSICVLLALLNIACGIDAPQFDYPRSLAADTATLPLSAIVVMLAANKLAGTKIDAIQNSRWDRLFFLLLLAASALITAFVFKPLLEFLK
jgi:hypothetical protein